MPESGLLRSTEGQCCLARPTISRTVLFLVWLIALGAACTSSTEPPGPSAIEGTYATTLTNDDGVRAGLPRFLSIYPQVIDGNTGHFTLTIEGGRVTLLQTTSQSTGDEPWLATYVVSGDRVTFVKPDGLTGYSERTFRWRADQRQLTLQIVAVDPPEPVIKAIMDMIFGSHPWRRISPPQSPGLP
jgi:hypothetical protein